MKQAILIMAHKDRAQIEKLINYFNGKCDIIIHLDKKGQFSSEDVRILSEMPGVRKVFRKISVYWAGYSLLRCQMLLLEQALKYSDCRYIHLLSGQDYPLKPLCEFLKVFENENREFIGGAHLPAPHWDDNTYKRIQYFYFTDWLRLKTDEQIRKVWNFARKQEHWGLKRRIPDQVNHLYGGSAWFSLTRQCTEAIVDYTKKHPSLYKRFNFTFAPDEIYIQTVARHVDFVNKRFANTNLRYIHWAKSGDNHPKDLDETFFHEISSSGAFFARKFDRPICEKLELLIDEYMLKNEKIIYSETGAWMTNTFVGHFFDEGLSKGIIMLCKASRVKDVVDLGCGVGWYVTALRREKIAAVGYDGNPNTASFSNLFSDLKDFPCEQADLTDNLVPETPYEMTLFLSVGEYIPTKYENVVWENLINTTNRYLVIGWGTPDLYSCGVVNPHTVDYIIRKGKSLGLKVDGLATKVLRENCWNTRYRNSIIVFIK